MASSEFKIGDRLSVVDVYDITNLVVGDMATVTGTCDACAGESTVKVRLDREPDKVRVLYAHRFALNGGPW